MSKEFRLFDHIDEKVQEGEFLVGWDYSSSDFYMYFSDDENLLYTFKVDVKDYYNLLEESGIDDEQEESFDHEQFIINNTMDCLILAYNGYDERNKRRVV